MQQPVVSLGLKQKVWAEAMQVIRFLTEGEGSKETKRGQEQPWHLSSRQTRKAEREERPEWEPGQSGDPRAKIETVYTNIHLST